MRHLFTSITLGVLLYSFTAPSQMENVITALKKSDASGLAVYFDNTVDLTLPKKSHSYSKSQAQMVLRDFFAVNRVNGFDIIYRNESTKAQFCVGNLRTTSKAIYRTTIYIKVRGGQAILQELRIEGL